MTNAEAGRVRACINCGAHGAWLCRTTKGANPWRAMRLCYTCLQTGDWYEYGLVDREPMSSEDPSIMGGAHAGGS